MGGGSNFPNFLHYFGGFLPPGRANVAMGYRRRFEVADSRQVPWLSCRLEEWVRRFGASLPMRMTASWFRSLDLPHTRLWRDSTAPESGLPSDCHPDCIIVLEAVRMSPGEIEPRTRRWKKCVTLLDSKSPIQGTRYKSAAAFFNHLRPSQEIDGLLGIADENILKDASFLRRDPPALQ